MKRTILVGLLAAPFGACAGTTTPPSVSGPGVDTLVMVDTVRVNTESPVNAQLENRVARLQIQVAERDVQLEQLRSQLEGTRVELVRNMARLQTQASRAEAASGMSEAEIALEGLERAPGGTALREFEEADLLFAQSSEQFEAENYGGALYLATQVRTLARDAQGRLRTASGGQLRDDETPFASPVPLVATGRSNVRSGPGLDFEVLFTLDADERLVGHSYTGEWVRIVDSADREGWIFHTLVASPSG